MKAYRYAALAACLAILSGCAAFGLVTPKTFPERLAYGYATNTALRNTASNHLTTGLLSSEDGTYVLGITDQTRTYLDAAKLASQAGDPTTAEGRLALAINVLDQLEAYLTRKVTP